MAEQASEHTTIGAPPALCWEVATDFEAYPQWAKDIKEAEIVHRDTDGRASVVRYRAAAMGRSTTYLLGYDYTAAPTRLAWRLLEGDITRQLDGSYDFHAVDGDGPGGEHGQDDAAPGRHPEDPGAGHVWRASASREARTS